MSNTNENSSISTHPATGFYSDSSKSTGSSKVFTKRSKEVTRRTVTKIPKQVSESDLEEYQVVFPPTKLRIKKSEKGNIPHHDHVTVSQCINRQSVGSRCPPSYVSNDSCIFDTPHSTSDSYDTFHETRRLQSIGNMFKSAFHFFQENPLFTKYLLALILVYVLICNLEIMVPRIISLIVRFFYPWCRYFTVIVEQFFSTIANMFTRLDAVIYATYCEFAAKYCRTHRLMCDVGCSFVDHVLSQSRVPLTPPPNPK